MEHKKLHVGYSLDALADSAEAEHYVLRLFVTGMTARSADAISRIKSICEEHLQDRYVLEIIDIYKQPELAKEDQVLAVPTLVKKLPAPLRRLIGDLTDVERVLQGLDICTVT